MLISQNSHFNLHQTTYMLLIGQQQKEWSSARFSFQINIKPLTNCKWESNRMDNNQ